VKPKRPRSLTLGLLLAAGWAAIAVVALAATTPLRELHPGLEVAAWFAGPVLTVAIAGAAASAAALRPWTAALYVAAGLALALALRPQWFPPHEPPAQGGAGTRVYFANVWARNDRLADIGRSITEADADVVALIEVTETQAAGLSLILKDYEHSLSGTPSPRFEGGPRTVVASKHPIAKRGATYADGLAVIEAEVRTPDGPVRLVVVHLTRPWPYDDPRAQERQLTRLVERINEGGGDNVVLVGDFNATPTSRRLTAFREQAGLQVAPAPTGTWPSPLPGPLRIAIDNAFVGPELSVVSRKIGRANGSDHRPVIVEVARSTPSG
jgi:endonuclease/exonuclease/phosphatase (EEP) superfamily protein YafD